MAPIRVSFQLLAMRFSIELPKARLIPPKILSTRSNFRCLKSTMRKYKICVSSIKNKNQLEVWRLERRPVVQFMSKAFQNTQLTRTKWSWGRWTKATIIVRSGPLSWTWHTSHQPTTFHIIFSSFRSTIYTVRRKRRRIFLHGVARPFARASAARKPRWLWILLVNRTLMMMMILVATMT